MDSPWNRPTLLALGTSCALGLAEVLSINGSLATAAGQFTGVLRIEETTPLEPGSKEYKLYAPGVGLLQDGSLNLVKYGPAAAR